MFAFALRPPDSSTTVPAVPWLTFAEFRVGRTDTLDNCLAEFPPGAGRAAAWPLLAFQVTFDLAQLLDDGRPTLHRAQYARAWRLGTCVPDAVIRMAARALLLPFAVRWDDTPAVAFELCERLSPARDATRLKKMRSRPLRTYLLFVGAETFAPRLAESPDGRPRQHWQRVAAEAHVLRPVARRPKPVPVAPPVLTADPEVAPAA